MPPSSERDRFGHLLFYGIVILVGFLVFRVVRPFLQPLGWAAIFAVMLHPLHGYLARRLGAGRASLATVLLAAVLLVGPALGLLSLLTQEVVQLTAQLQNWQPSDDLPIRLMALWDRVRALSPLELPADPTALLVEASTRVAGFVAPRAGGVLRDAAQFLFSLMVMLFALFFLLRDGQLITSTIRRLLPFDESRRDRLVMQTRDLIVASVGAGLAVAAVQGLIGGVAYAALGVPAPAFWGVITAFCALLPVVGATIVWLPLALWLFFSGEPMRGVIMLVVGVFGIGLVDNILRPLLMSGRSAANGLVMFIGLLGGVAAFGFIGLVLGPIVLVAAGTLLDVSLREDGV